MKAPRQHGHRIPVLVIDRPEREGDHLFVATHQSKPVVGAVGADWQRDPKRRARAGLQRDWRATESRRLRASLEVPGTGGVVAGLELFDVGGRPMFVTPESLIAGLGEEHGGDDGFGEQVRGWYQAAWTVVAMTQFIDSVAHIRQAMIEAGQDRSKDFEEVELELSQARLAITQAKTVLAMTKKRVVTPVTGET